MEVILDFDGTLVDGCGYSPSWLFDLAKSHGYLGSEDEAGTVLRGCTDFNVAARLGIVDRPEEFTHRLLERNCRGLDSAYCDPELHRVLEILAERYVLHVVSNRDQLSLEAGLRRLECRQFFRSCVGSAPRIEGKPAARLYERLRSAEPASAELVVYIGDRAIDREFAAQAGLVFLAARWYRDVLQGDEFSCLELREVPGCLRSLEAALAGRLKHAPVSC